MERMMHTETIKVSREEATELYRKYKEHQAYSAPIDWEVQRTYQLLAQGKVIIRAIESVRLAGLDDQGLPKLALAPATAAACHIRRERNGSLIMSPDDNFWRQRKNQFLFRQETFAFPVESFQLEHWSGKPVRAHSSTHKAVMPTIPIHLRPKRALENYHVLWEAEWHPVPPRDPYLLRRIGKADLWLVVAHWDLTEVERAALATRI
jgi:hypothetical protein